MAEAWDDDAAIIAAAREGFLVEAAEMLQQFEQALLGLEVQPGDAELLGAAFRAAHTIKGTAGLFGCDAVVAFTHEVETLMEALRAGELAADDTLCAVLLESRDQMEALLQEVDSGAQDPAVAMRSAELGARLRALLPGGGTAAAVPSAGTGSAPAPQAAPGAGRGWRIALAFGPDALRNGLDPLAFIRYLSRLGSECRVVTHAASVPVLEQLDAEACHLAFDIELCGEASREEVEAVFEFALEDCTLAIEPMAVEAACAPEALPATPMRAAPAAAGPSGAKAEPAAGAGRPADGGAAPAAASSPAAAAAGPERRQAAGRPGEDARFVRVRADKLDALIDLIGELVIAGSGAQMVAHQAGVGAFLEATARVGELIQQARDGALALRMVPIGETFNRFQRVVRDVCKQLGKRVELVITGGDTELDKSMVEAIADPLMHLVRNSLDHGLEAPAARTAAGKSESGRLSLHAWHEAGSIVIEVADDGRGLDRERIVAKAVQRGLLAPDAVLSDAEVWNLIFAPGFSTAEQVTDLSGRGVGMDVVKRNIEALRGQIALHSSAGAGTRTQIRLPLTLAMIDGFLTQVGGVHYVLPLAVVAECIDLPPEVEGQAGRVAGTFDLRGEVLPWLDVARFYGHTPADGAAARRRSLVVVRDGAIRLALVVERLLGEHQTVIKPLASIFRRLQGLAGSTVLGSGDVALVLDVAGLMACATRPATPVAPASAAPALAQATTAH